MKLYKNFFDNSDSFKQVFNWINFELMKTTEKKRESVLNKTLVITGPSGVGKTTFLRKIIHPVFKTGPLFLDSEFQTPQAI